MNTFFLIALSMIAFTSSIPYPSIYDYSSANSLVNYLVANAAYYYTPNSLFFQSSWYITYEDSLKIIGIMDNIYQKYNLNGVFLVVSDEAAISNIKDYSASVVDLLNTKGVYHKENVYSIILYYSIGAIPVGGDWILQISIATGTNAQHYVSSTDAQNLINDWGYTLKRYSYSNLVSFMKDIERIMDIQGEFDNLPLGTKILLVVIVIVVLIIAAVCSLISRRYCGCCLAGKVISGGSGGASTKNYAGGIQVTTGTF